MKMRDTSRCGVSDGAPWPLAYGISPQSSYGQWSARSVRLPWVLVATELVLLVLASALCAQPAGGVTNVAIGTAPSAPGMTNPAVPGPVRAPDYAEFRVIVERNIFAARRSGRVTGRGGTSGQASAPRRTEYFVLVGTLEYGQKKVAFFDGSESVYRKAVREGETLAEFRLSGIGYKSVRLEASTNVFELQVGWAMRKNAVGEWEPSREFVEAGSRREMISAASGGNVSSGTQSAQMSGAASDVLRRLMERREREMQ